MKADLAKDVRTRFERAFLVSFPQFQRLKKPEVPSDWRVYGWRQSEGLSVYVTLGIANHCDDFTVEVAWSRLHRFPSHIPVGVPEWDPNAIPVGKATDVESSFRAWHLWEPGRDVWWRVRRDRDVPDEFDDLLPPLPPLPGDERARPVQEQVDDAITRIRDHVMPYFRSLA